MDQITTVYSGNAPATQRYLSPRARRRMWWIRIHRWLGIGLLIPIAALGLTGSMLVWPEWTEHLANPGRTVAASADPVQFDAADIAAAREALAPYGPIASLRIAEAGKPLVATATLPPAEGERPVSWSAYVDTQTSAVLDLERSDTTLRRWAHDIHGVLLIRGWGRQLVGWMGVFLLVSAISGLVIFWPGTRRALAALKWQRRDGKALNIHRQSGVILSVVIIVEAVTGAWISFPQFMASLVEPGVEQPQRGRGRPGGPGGSEGDVQPVRDAAWVVALGKARGAVAGRPSTISAPVGEDGAWSVEFVSEESETMVTVPVAGGEASVQRQRATRGPAEPQTRAQAIAGSMRQVHYASIGGAIWEWLVFLSGLVLTFLACSGVYVWAKRKLRRG